MVPRGLAKLGVISAGVLLALPACASGAWSSTISGSTATMVSSAGASDALLVRADGGFLRHNQTGGGFASQLDFDSTNGPTVDQLANDSGSAVSVDAGNGNDALQLGTTARAASLIAAPVSFGGGSEFDRLTVEDGNAFATPNAQLLAGVISGIGPATFTYSNLESLQLLGGNGGADHYSLFPGLPATTEVFGFSGADTFALKQGATASLLDGGPGEDTVDFSGHASAVSVAAADAALAGSEMDGSQEVPPGSGHPTAFGGATLRLDLADNTFDIQMSVDGITPATDTISGTHVHSAPSGANGPVIVDLLSGPEQWVDNGSGGMTFSKNDIPFPPGELENFHAGNTYVNIHTTTPPHPEGAIRGQLSSIGYRQAATGATLLDIQRYKGGAGADTISGTPGADVLDGSGGADQLFGLGGNDILNAQDGIADTTLDCGLGTGDVANRDRASIDPVPLGCEAVNTLPEPPPPDGDGDGVPDESDSCPTVAAATASGCPAGAKPPGNDIAIRKPSLNTQRGTGKLPVDVPGAGVLELTGKGLKPVEKPVAGAGTVNVPLRPTGRTADKLHEDGKVKVTAEVTFTPTGGAANTESKKVTLKDK